MPDFEPNRNEFLVAEVNQLRIILEHEINRFWIVYLAFLLQKSNKSFSTLKEALSLIADKEVYNYISQTLHTVNISDIDKFINIVIEFDQKALETYILQYKTEGDFKLPYSVNVLASKSVNLNKNDVFIDAFPRDGEFLVITYKNYGVRQAIGFQISREMYICNKIKADVINAKIEFINYSFLNAKVPMANKYFLMPPLNMKISDKEFYFEEVKRNYPELENSRTCEILYIVKALENLKEDGKIVCIIHAGFLSNTGRSELSFRKWLADNHYVETCINLPPKIAAPYLGVQLTLLILSKSNKDGFRVIDFPKDSNEAKNVLNDSKIDEIIEAKTKDTPFSSFINYKNISDSYNLNPEYYLAKREVEYRDAEKNLEIGKIATIIRGCNSIQKELDIRTSVEPTLNKFLTASWEQDRQMPSELRSLKEIKDNELKYCLKEGDLILSKMGQPKFDVAHNIENKKILVSGNLYIVRFDTNIVNPMYVKCFLNSCSGYELLDNALTGTTTPTLSVEMLSRIKIPIFPMEVQEQIAQRFSFYESMKSDFYEKIQKIDNRLESLFEDVLTNKDILYFTDDGEPLL